MWQTLYDHTLKCDISSCLNKLNLAIFYNLAAACNRLFITLKIKGKVKYIALWD